MSGLIGKKIGMTSIFDENGKNIPCTVIEAGPCVVTQVRTEEVDGYEALQLGFDDKAEKHANKAEMGHFKKAGTSPKKKVVEFQDFEGEYKLGDTVDVDLFIEGEFVDVSRCIKRKRFPGCCKTSRFWWCWTSNSRSAQPFESARFHWSVILSITRIQRNAYGGKNGRRQCKSSKPKSFKSSCRKRIFLVLKGCVPGHNNSYVIIQK